MFKVFIAESILRNIIQTESQRPNNSRSNLFKVLKSAKNLYVAMDVPDFAWIKQLKDHFGLVAFNKTVGTADQTITPQVLFTEDSLNRHSSAPLRSMEQIISTLREFSNSLSSPSTKHSSYDYAVNGQWMEKCMCIRNRLTK